MEDQIFIWKEWDIIDTTSFSYDDCTLKMDVGNYKAGTVLPQIIMDYTNGEMQFYDTVKEGIYHVLRLVATFELTFNIKQK